MKSTATNISINGITTWLKSWFKKASALENGTVKFFNQAKGFGFIRTENGQELFVHIKSVKQKIRQNDKVVFQVEQSAKGLNAINVSLA